jgi:ubiquinone/menaquinone biosynthesis C-methylase UbiE
MENHVCPWYYGYFLTNPLRRLFQNPDAILAPFIEEGMSVLEVGPGMGFFSLSLANLVGDSGRLYCVELQVKMLEKLNKRIQKAGLEKRAALRLCANESLRIDDLENKIDLAFVFAVAHEAADQKLFLVEIMQSLKRDGLLFISEPKGHVSLKNFEATLSFIRKSDFNIVTYPNIKGNYSVVLRKN